MFTVDEDLTLHVTRGDSGEVTISAVTEADDGTATPFTFHAGDTIRLKVFEKKNCENVVLQKDFGIEDDIQEVTISLEGYETKIGETINKPVVYWYELELNPFSKPQTIIGYDEDGARMLKLYPEGKDGEIVPPTPEEIGHIDAKLDLTSQKAIQNQAVARAIAQLKASIKKVADESTKSISATDKAVELTNEEITLLNARVTNLASLDEGSTTGDAELKDVRVGCYGKVYSSAGESVREQIKPLSKDVQEALRLLTGEIKFNIIEHEYVTESGVVETFANWNRTDYTNCSGITTLYIERDGFEGNNYNAFYDADKNFISKFPSYRNSVTVPENAKYFIMSAAAANLASIKVKADFSLIKECSEKAASVNGIKPDENGNVNIKIPSQLNVSVTDGECYFVRKEIKPYFTDYPENVTNINDDSYIDGKISSVPNGDSFLFVTDMHYTENNKNSLLPMLYAYKRLGLNTVVHGGDVLESENTKEIAGLELRKWANDMYSCFGKRLLPVFGNHDANWAGISFSTATDKQKETVIIPYETVEKILLNGCRSAIVQETDDEISQRYADWIDNITDNADKKEFIAWCKLHYYCDDVVHKTRHIILNKVGFSPILRKYFGEVDTELKLQTEWLYDVLCGTPDDYNIVVSSHIFVEWQTNSITNVQTLNVMKLLSLAKTNSSGTFNIATGWNNNAQVMQNKTFDFTGRNRTGKIICLCGHSHWDYSCVCHTVDGTYKSEDYTDNLTIGDDGILCIMTQTDAIRSANYKMSEYPLTSVQATMTDGTVTEQCFDIVTVTDDKVICTRIGAGNDRIYNY